jgi:hypothetical protein
VTSRLETLWAELAAIVGSGFEPVDDADLAALRRHYQIPAWFEALMRTGYPAGGVRVFGTQWFSPPTELTRYLAGCPAPARWFPVEICEGHKIHVVSDAPGVLTQVDLEASDALEGPGEPSRFGSFERVLESLLVLVPLARAHSARGPGGALLTRAGEEALVGALGPERAEDVCELFHIERVSRVRARCERAVRRSNQLALATAVVAFVAGVCALALSRGPWIAVLAIVAFVAVLVGCSTWLGAILEKRQLLAAIRADVPPASERAPE